MTAMLAACGDTKKTSDSSSRQPAPSEAELARIAQEKVRLAAEKDLAEKNAKAEAKRLEFERAKLEVERENFEMEKARQAAAKLPPAPPAPILKADPEPIRLPVPASENVKAEDARSRILGPPVKNGTVVGPVQAPVAPVAPAPAPAVSAPAPAVQPFTSLRATPAPGQNPKQGPGGSLKAGGLQSGGGLNSKPTR